MRIVKLAAAGLLLSVIPATAFAQNFASEGEVAAVMQQRAGAGFADFYASRRYAPVWVANGQLSPAGESFLSLLQNASLDGLETQAYELDSLRKDASLMQGDEDRIADLELRMMQTFVSYVRDLKRPSGELIYASAHLREPPTQQALLDEATRAPDFAAYVSGMEFMNPAYVQLRDALLQAEERGRSGIKEIPEGPTLKLGDTGARVAILRERLGLEYGEEFDVRTAEAVAQFQASANLTDDGIAGSRTLSALNGPGTNHVGLLRTNLERARALPSAWTRHVLVNAASAQLSYFGDGAEQGNMKVVVGTKETPTPMMAGMLQYATLNPYWNVPVSLAKKTIAPAILRGATLKGMGYEALSGWDEDAVIIEQKQVNWKAVADGSEQVRLRKLPSADNAMGKVKYIFPNDEGIYLHDTPTRNLFREDARQFSNGCIRLEDATRLGRWLFEGDAARLDAATDAPEQHTLLPEQVPVFITYMTAIPANGTIAFTEDVYGYDGVSSSFLASR